MRSIIQRVKKAQVKVVETGKIAGSINQGLFILFGVGGDDTLEIAERMAEKILKLRIMSDKDGKMNLSIADSLGEVLVVSQFTLYADITGGNRPSFVKAGKPELAKKIYNHFLTELKKSGLKVENGSFGEYMEINTELDGPVTIVYDAP